MRQGDQPKKAAIYHRVSTTDQDPELARHELRAAATARSMIVTMEIEETGSGGRNDRPGLQRVLDAARRGQLSAVLVHKLDRWGRSALDVLHNIRALEEAGCEFIVTSQGLHIRPAGDSVSRLILGVLASVAEFERSLIVERVTLGMRKAKALGRHVGRPRSGNAPEPRAVASLRAAGASWRSISVQLACTPGSSSHATIGAHRGHRERGVCRPHRGITILVAIDGLQLPDRLSKLSEPCERGWDSR